jgi:hypothetical protein
MLRMNEDIEPESKREMPIRKTENKEWKNVTQKEGHGRELKKSS